MKLLGIGLVGLLLLIAQNSIAQELSDYGIKSLNQRDGLLSGKVTSILKDRKGFVWIGTDNGLNKYDGKNLSQICLLQPCESLAEVNVRDIYEGDDETLIIATNIGAFSIGKDRTSINYIDLGIGDYAAIAIVSKNNRVFLGTSDKIFELEISNENVSNKLIPLTTNFITNLIIRNNELWIGTWGRGLFVYNLDNQRYIEFNAAYKQNLNGDSIKRVMTMALDLENELWLGDYENGLYHINEDFQVEKFEHDDDNPNSLNSNKVKSLAIDKKGYVWIGLEESGLDRLAPAVKHFDHYYADFQNKSIYEGYSVYDIYLDNQDQIWLGFRNDGLKIVPLHGSIFKHYELDQLNPNNNIVVGIGSDNDNLIIGAKGGIYIGESADINNLNFYSLPNNESPLAIYNTKDKIYLGTMLGTIFTFDLSSKSFSELLPSELASLFKGFKVNSFYQISDNQILIGSQKGTYSYNMRKKTLSSVIDTWTHTFLPSEEDGSILLINFGSNQYQYYPETGKVNTIPINIGRNVKAGSLINNELFLGTDLGFFKFNLPSKELTHYKTIFPLINSQVNAMIKDRFERIWVSTHENIYCYNPRKNLFRVFSEAEGLKKNRFRDEMAIALPNDHLGFGGNNGLTVVDASAFDFNGAKTNLEFTKIQINNSSKSVSDNVNLVNNEDQLSLSYDQNNLTISFSLLNYINPEHHTYQYKLNSNSSWINLGSTNQVTLVDLRPGNHQLLVRAANENGIWSNAKIINLEVTPPLLRSSYFIALYFLIGALIVISIFKFRSKQLRLAKDYEIEHLKAENIREKSDREAEFHNMRLMFFTNISHEFRTPLTLILAPLEKFIQKGISPTAEHLQLMYRNAERLRRLIGQILDFRKMEAEELKIEPSIGDIIKYTHECSNLFKQLAQNKKIDFKVNCQSDSLLVIFDKDKYEKILINLLSNAFKFTEKGSINLNLRHESREGNKCTIFIQITDTGLGIEEEHIKNVFDRYYHVTSKVKNETNGTGIGLSLVKQLVEMHNGIIFVESTYGSGTTFKLELNLDLNTAHDEVPMPYTEIESDIKTETSLSADLDEEQETDIHLPSILFVEDDEDLIEYLHVEFHGKYHVLSEKNGELGIKSAIKNIPDIIVSDISMPIMSGLEMSEILKNDDRTSHIPIVLLTAHGSEVHQKKGFEIGVEDFITKPFSTDILELRINNLLRSRKELQDRFRKEFKVEPNGLPSASMDQTFLNKAMSIIEENLNNSEFNANQFADEMCMSRVHLYRKLKALTNESVSGFVKMVRLKLAADLLRDKKMNIKEAAYTVGFSDPKYFSKCFKQHFGVKPSDFVENPLSEGTQAE